MPKWLFHAENDFVSIGSSQSIFNQHLVLNSHNRQSNLILRDKVEQTLFSLQNLDDDQLFRLEKVRAPQNYKVKMENTSYIVPKLTLLYSVMKMGQIE